MPVVREKQMYLKKLYAKPQRNITKKKEKIGKILTFVTLNVVHLLGTLLPLGNVMILFQTPLECV